MSFYEFLEDWLDAGLVALEPRGEIILTDQELSTMNPEELAKLNNLVLYPNQMVLKEEDILALDMRIVWKYNTPCITTLKEEQ